MKIFVHTLNTWLVANLIHPVVFIIYFLWLNDAEGNNWGAGFFLIGVFSFCFYSFLTSFLVFTIRNNKYEFFINGKIYIMDHVSGSGDLFKFCRSEIVV